MGVPLPQKGADGIEIALGVEDLRHNAAPFLFLYDSISGRKNPVGEGFGCAIWRMDV
jgi:hypothetical protein